jgi:hypothetical protein
VRKKSERSGGTACNVDASKAHVAEKKACNAVRRAIDRGIRTCAQGKRLHETDVCRGGAIQTPIRAV